MQRIHPAPVELTPTARLGIEMVLPFATHEDFAVLRDLEPFCI